MYSPSPPFAVAVFLAPVVEDEFGKMKEELPDEWPHTTR
jgi:hypothetical protein